MRRLTWTAPALADLREINAFLRREADGKTAVRTLSAIRQRANLLKEFPHAGPLVEDQTFRSLKVLTTPFVIAYRLEPASAQLLRVFHGRSEEHTSELQSLMRISYAVFCLKKQKSYINN